MSATVLDATPIITRLRRQCAEDLQHLRRELKGIEPGLGILLVTGDQVTMAQTDKISRAAQEMGIGVVFERIAERRIEEHFGETLGRLTTNDALHAIYVATPHPNKPDFDQIVAQLPGRADISGLHYVHVGHLAIGKSALLPPRAAAAWELVLEYVENYKEYGVVIIASRNDGARGYLGRSLALHCMNLNLPVTLRTPLTHRGARETAGGVYNPDGELIISLANTIGAITRQNIRPGSVVIDGGNNFHLNRVSGDGEFQELKEVAGMLSTVPGGVDALTPWCAMRNFVELLKREYRTEPEETAFGLKARRRL